MPGTDQYYAAAGCATAATATGVDSVSAASATAASTGPALNELAHHVVIEARHPEQVPDFSKAA